MIYLRVLCKFHVAERTKNVLSLITTPFSPYNLNPTATFKDCKINMHLCSKSPVQPQGKYLDNNSFVCTLPFFLPSLFSLSLFSLLLLPITSCTPHCHFILHAPLPFHIALSALLLPLLSFSSFSFFPLEMHLTAINLGQNNGKVLRHKPSTCIGTFREKFNTTFVLPETQWQWKMLGV